MGAFASWRGRSAAPGLGIVLLATIAACASGVHDGDSGIGFAPVASGPSPTGNDGPATEGEDDDDEGDEATVGGTGVDGGSEATGGGDNGVPTGSCEAGDTQPCYSGPIGSDGVGGCVSGSVSCEGGMWGPCVGEVLPATETCNGLDDDCNGTIDDAIADAGAPCDTGMPGVCVDGTTSCTGGQPTCDPLNVASAEVCDAADNDCNGQVDDGNPGGGAACNTGQAGVCGAGTETCAGGSIVCNQNQQPGAEACGDGQDNDCDGQADENCCAHDPCVIGVAMMSGCSTCVTQICAADPFCCNNSWDVYCVDAVPSVCGMPC